MCVWSYVFWKKNGEKSEKNLVRHKTRTRTRTRARAPRRMQQLSLRLRRLDRGDRASRRFCRRARRRGGRFLRPSRVKSSSDENNVGDGGDDDDDDDDDESYERFVQTITAPRVEFGSKIHRTLHHHAFSKHKSYAYQWQAFCARSQQYDYRDVISEDAETFLSAFHFKLEDGCKRFERDVESGKAMEDWDAASANHPTLGLVAIVASWKASVEAVCGRTWLFEEQETEREKEKKKKNKTAERERPGGSSRV